MSIWSVPVSGQTTTSDYQLVKSDVGIISSLGPTRDGTLFYKLLPASLGIYTAAYDTASGQLSSAPVQPQQFKGANFLPELSPDGKHLAYMSRRDILVPTNVTNHLITVLTMATGDARDVVPALSYGTSGRWLPDGQHFLVYGADLKGRRGIFKVHAATGSVTLVEPRHACALTPIPAADGRSLFCYRHENKQLTQLDSSTGAVLRSFTIAGQPYALSPDGRYLLFRTEDERGPRSLQIFAPATGETRELLALSPPTSQAGNSLSLDFTPDSKSVVFYGRLNGVDGMWRVPIEGGNLQRINLNVGPIFSWRFNAKTSQVAFSTDGPDGRLEIWKMENFLPTSRSTRR